MSIKRFLPDDEYQAAINANAPTLGNPFATMLDVSGGGSSIYTADGTVGAARVATLTDSLTFISLGGEELLDIFDTGIVQIANDGDLQAPVIIGTAISGAKRAGIEFNSGYGGGNASSSIYDRSDGTYNDGMTLNSRDGVFQFLNAGVTGATLLAFHIKQLSTLEATTNVSLKLYGGTTPNDINDGVEMHTYNASNVSARRFSVQADSVGDPNAFFENIAGLGVGTPSPTARLHVKGAGATDATNAFYVENSLNGKIFIVQDDNQVICSNALNDIGGNIRFGTLTKQVAFLSMYATGGASATLSIPTQSSDTSNSWLAFDVAKHTPSVVPYAGLKLYPCSDRVFDGLSLRTNFNINMSTSPNISKGLDFTLTGVDPVGSYQSPVWRFYSWNGIDSMGIGYGNHPEEPGNIRRFSIHNSPQTTGGNALIEMVNCHVGIGTSTPQASALLDVDSTDQGFLIPRMTGVQVEAISSPADGLQVYATSIGATTITGIGWWGYNGVTWIQGYEGGAGNIYTTNGTVGASRTVTLTDELAFTDGQIIIIGGGSTSASEALYIENSSSVAYFRAYDDAKIAIGETNNSGTITSASLKVGGTSNGAICFSDANYGIALGGTGGTIAWGGGSLHLGVSSVGLNILGNGTSQGVANITALTSSHRSMHYALGVSSTENGDGHAFFVKDSAASPSGGNDQRVFTIGNRPTVGGGVDNVPCSFENITGLVVGANVSSLDASAILQTDSTTQGFLPPRMTNAQMITLGATAIAGLMVYDTDNDQWMGYNDTSWVILG